MTSRLGGDPEVVRVGKTHPRLSVSQRRFSVATLLTAALAVTLGLAPATAIATTTTAISTGGFHACARRSAGGVECWGYNAFGQLGDGTTTSKPTPTAVSGLTSGVAAISGGLLHTCALMSAGAVKCWGDNEYGQLGDGTTTSKPTPTAVSGLSSGVIAISAGGAHTCALTNAGRVECWGENGEGQLGDGTTTNKPTPTAVSGLSSGVIAISAGELHTCALMSAGEVKCWGENGSGQLGDGTTTNKPTPTAVSGLSSGVIAVSAGGSQTCALTSSGAVKCWGYNEYGQLGDGTTTNKSTPVGVSGLGSGVAAISAGLSYTCALKSAGGLECWGENNFGQLGDGTTTSKPTPTAVSGLGGGVTAISAGAEQACALTRSSGVECWGENRDGQLGDGTTTSKTTPTHVVGLVRATCATNTATVELSPGLSDTAAVQTLKIKGTLTGCTGEPFRQTKYTATLKTTGPVSCSVLKAAGEVATGVAKYKWTPSAKSSKGTLNMLLTETSGVPFSGEATSGSYAPLPFSGTTTQSYDGAAICNTTTVKKGVFSGSAVNFE
jgi:alpha-tubulin suppressor-like RCC1 family protein